MSQQHTDFINIRVFISSTFRDFHAERDYLIKNVFPELREWGLRYRLNLVDIDLRWGITREQAESGKVIELCLQEIDGARPFFICLLGGRYGWIPGSKNFPRQIDSYPKARDKMNLSITHMEIEHAVIQPYRTSEDEQHRMNSFFYLRNDHSYPTNNELTGFSNLEIEEFQNTFLEQTPEGIERLKNLKSQVYDLYNKKGDSDNNIHSYKPSFDTTLLNPEEKVLKGRFAPDSLRPLGKQVIADLKRTIGNSYRKRIAYYNSIETNDIEFDQSNFLIEAKSRVFAGRSGYLNAIMEFATSQKKEILLVSSDSGSGKSTILSKASQILWNNRKMDCITLRFFSGLDTETDSAAGMLYKLVKQLASHLDLKIEIPNSLVELVRVFYQLVNKTSKPIVVFIDGLNQFDDPTKAITWIDDSICNQLRFIISCTPNNIPEALSNKKLQNLWVSPFDDDEKIELLEIFPSVYSKTLSESQKQAILRKTGSGNPLYLKTLLEELRLFGSFEQIEARISELPNDLPLLLNTLLQRFEDEYGQEIVLWFFICIDLAEQGLTETELDEMLSHENERNTLPLLIRQARPLLLYNGPYIKIAHQAVSEAIRSRYLKGYADNPNLSEGLKQGVVIETNVHNSMMSFFLRKGSDAGQWVLKQSREARGFHYHALKAGRPEAIKPFLSKPSFLISSCQCRYDADSQVFRGFFDFMHLLYVSFDIPVAKGIIDFCRSRTYLLSRFPRLIPNELFNYSFEIDDPILRKLLEPSTNELNPGIRVVQINIPNANITGHKARISSMSVSPIGVHFLTGSVDGSVALWEREKKTPIVFGHFHRSIVSATAFSPDGQHGLTSSEDGTLLLWDCVSGETTILKTHDTQWNNIPFAAFTDNSTILYVQNSRIAGMDIHSRITQWSDEESLKGYPNLWRRNFAYDHETTMLGIALTNGSQTELVIFSTSQHCIVNTANVDMDISLLNIKGNYLLATETSGRLVVFNISIGQLDILQIDFKINSIGTLLNHDFLLADNRANIWVYKPEQEQISKPLPLAGIQGWDNTSRIIFCKQSFRLLISVNDGAIYEFCMRDKDLKFKYEPSFSINRAVVTPQGVAATTGAFQIANRSYGERVCLIEPNGAIRFSTNNNHNSNITDIEAVENSKLVTFHSNGQVVTWENLEPISSLHFDNSFTVAYSDLLSPAIVLGTDKGELLAFQPPSSLNKINFNFPKQTFAHFVNALYFSSQSLAFLVASGNGAVSYFDKNSNWTVQPDSLRVSAVTLTPDCHVAAAGNINGTIRIIDKGKVIIEKTLRPTGIVSLIFSSDGAYLWVAYADGNILCLSTINLELVTGTLMPGVPLKMTKDGEGNISVVSNCGISIIFNISDN
jgi:WD40 repeat protein